MTPPDVDRGLSLQDDELDALRYVLNWADSTSRVRTIMKTFTSDRVTTEEKLERLYERLKAWNTRPTLEARPLPEGVGGLREVIEDEARFEANPDPYEVGFADARAMAAAMIRSSTLGSPQSRDILARAIMEMARPPSGDI